MKLLISVALVFLAINLASVLGANKDESSEKTYVNSDSYTSGHSIRRPPIHGIPPPGIPAPITHYPYRGPSIVHRPPHYGGPGFGGPPQGGLPGYESFYSGYYSLVPVFEKINLRLESSDLDVDTASKLIGSLGATFVAKVQSLGARCANAQYISLERKRQFISIIIQLFTHFQSSLNLIYRRWPGQIYAFKDVLARSGEAFRIAFGLIHSFGFQPYDILGRLNLNLFSQFNLDLNSYIHSFF